MTKEELVGLMADEMESTREVAKSGLEAFISAVTIGLGDGEEVRIANFGTFKGTDIPAHTSRNPRTGDAVEVGPTVRISMKAGKGLKEEVLEARTGGKKKTAKKAPAKKAAAKAPAKKATAAAKPAAKATARKPVRRARRK